jgi:hypothetical protein
MARRRRPEEPLEAPVETGSSEVSPEDYLNPFWVLSGIQWPTNLTGADLVAWMRRHAPQHVQTDEQARSNRDRRDAAAHRNRGRRS